MLYPAALSLVRCYAISSSPYGSRVRGLEQELLKYHGAAVILAVPNS